MMKMSRQGVKLASLTVLMIIELHLLARKRFQYNVEQTYSNAVEGYSIRRNVLRIAGGVVMWWGVGFCLKEREY